MNEKTNRLGVSGDRQGVALILVIGMLALMMIAGMTFAIFMRTERVAAGNFRNDVQARQLLDGALARALNDIELSVGANPYPPWNFIQSVNGTETNMTALNGFTNWIPWSVIEGTNLAPRWENVTVPFFEGRVSYVVLNCSGLLDANYAGTNGVLRGTGTNVNEIQVGANGLGEVQDLSKYVSSRPYASLQELAVQGLTALPMNLFAYSACPLGAWDDGTHSVRTNLADVGGDVGQLMAANRKLEITTALKQCLFSSESPSVAADQADAVYNSLLDYVDGDCIPRNLAGPCAEAVPMINEVQAECRLDVSDPLNCTPGVIVHVEWFYPFVNVSKRDFAIIPKITITAAGAGESAFVPTPIPSDRIDDINFKVDETKYPNWAPTEIPMVLASGGGAFRYTDYTNKVMSFKIIVKLQVVEKSTGSVVDEVPSPFNSDGLAITIITKEVRLPATPPASGEIVTRDGFECLDPRFNWEAASGEQWIPYDAVKDATGIANSTNGSLGVVNNITKWYWDPASGNLCDGVGSMYVADKPLQSPGELSYLLRGATVSERWKTIRLITENGEAPDRVLDYFVVNKESVRRGVVNPNTKNENVLKALFYSMPFDRYPGETGSTVLTADEASDLASAWIADVASLPSPHNMVNLSQMGLLSGALSNKPSSSVFQKESIIRNTCNLLGVRQNTFEILLHAQTTKTIPGLNDKSVVSGISAIAEVWRDPYPLTTQAHPMFVRMLKVLDAK